MRLSDSNRDESRLSRGVFLTGIALAFTLGVSMSLGQAPAAPAAQATQPAAEGAPATAPAEAVPVFRCDDPSPAPLVWVHNFSEIKVGDKVETKDIWSGQTVEYAFVVHNDGQGVLKILEVRPTCGCTVAEYDKEIPPGGQGKIMTKLNTANINQEVVKVIHVKTNDPKAAQLSLQLKGKVKARVSLEPLNGAHFGQLGPTTPTERVVKLTNNTPTPLKLEAAPIPQQTPFTYELKEVEEGKVFEVKVALDRSKLREGPNYSQLILKTNIEEQPQVLVPANVYYPPIIQVQPGTSIAVSTPVTGNFSRRITLTRNEGPMQIKQVTSDNPAIKVEAAPAPLPATSPAGTPIMLQRVPNQVWNLTVNIDEGWEPPTPTTKPYEITVKTDVPEKEEIKISVHAYALRPQIQPETLIGKLAPQDGTLKTQTGQPMPIGGNTGKVTVTCFWTSWCPHCKRMLPIMQGIANVYASRGVDFNMISLDGVAKPEQVAKIVKDLGVTLPFAVDARQIVGKKYGANSFPVTFLIAKDGIVEDVLKGAPQSFEADVKARLDLLLEGKRRDSFPKPSTPTPVAQTTPPRPAGQASNNPMLVVDSTQQDMGSYKPGATGTYNLHMRNSGTGELKLTEVTTSEGLKLDPDYPKSVAGNAPASLRLQFTAPKQPGPFQHQVTIKSNDPSRETVQVKLTGTVRKLIELQPATGIDFGRRPNTFSMERLASLIWNGEGTVKFLSVESNSPKFEGEIRPIQQGPHHMVVARAKGPFDQGEHTGTLFVKTDCKEQPVIEVPVKLFQPPRIDVSPEVLTFTKAAHIQKGRVNITNNGSSSLHILAVKSSNPKIRTQVWPADDGVSYGLQVTVPTGLTPADGGEKITIRTDDSEYGEIVIPIKLMDGQTPGQGLSQVR
ncbi:MAG TPA: DUF1573 domain-containing protein [Phycisphaerae bacterium]|jgi:thiol-disulfide isomerase/thioredoxin|nr:DUF1573 domain-containing protein [Phycisphaerae bacterium]HOB76065.1 DUF1573 domain-containing protein [Phycisphaerae bacterium]HOJ55473.1 DUF1573 domain-containing protein [Phycisphaerae bacterium]HOL25702.1 DUF1573 domain-containing protein [Phycisphaerae bacterium]HPP19605.1 DUF1573 domain-containing protein [Phycisphaerae bacterium]